MAAVAVAQQRGALGLGKDEGEAAAAPGEASTYCRLVQELGEKSPSLDMLASGDRAALRRRVRESLRAARHVRAEAPPELRREAKVLLRAQVAFARLLEQHDYDVAALADDPAARRLEAPRRAERLAAAQRRVAAYNDEHCRAADAGGAR